MGNEEEDKTDVTEEKEAGRRKRVNIKKQEEKKG